jgi:hypothetical protein
MIMGGGGQLATKLGGSGESERETKKREVNGKGGETYAFMSTWNGA